MHQNVIGKNVRITDNVRTHIKEKMSRIRLNTDNIIDANIICENLKGEYTVNATLSFGKKLFHTKEVSDDLYKSIDKVFQKIEREIVKNKNKSDTGKHGSKSHSDAELSSGDKYTIKNVEAYEKPLTDNDALVLFKSYTKPYFAYLPIKTSKDMFSVKVSKYMTFIFKDSNSTIEKVFCKNDSADKFEWNCEYIKAISSDGTAAVTKKTKYDVNEMNVSEAVGYLVENKDENFIVYVSSITEQVEALYRESSKKFVLIRLFDI